MTLKYHPEPGTILICDFAGMREPEMVKLLPVVVISPRLKHRTGLFTVAPLSTTPPDHAMDYHCEVKLDPPLPPPFDSPSVWVKADMIYNVCATRLELVRTARDHTGKRKYLQRQIGQADLVRIRRAVLHGLGLGDLTKHYSPHLYQYLLCREASGFQDLLGGGRAPGRYQALRTARRCKALVLKPRSGGAFCLGLPRFQKEAALPFLKGPLQPAKYKGISQLTMTEPQT